MGVTKMGKNCTIHHRATIGMGPDRIPPEIGNNVLIKSGSIVFGHIKIGDGVVIEANSVLSKTIPPWSLVGGNPGRIVKRHIQPSTVSHKFCH